MLSKEKLEKKREYQRIWREKNRERDRATSRQWYHQNRDRAHKNKQRFNEANPDYQRNYDLVRKYGITLLEFNDLLKKQDGNCAICGTDKPNGQGFWHVDHDHSTGKIRGILCHHCNLLIGHAKDNPKITDAATRYLKKEGAEAPSKVSS